MAQVGTVKSRSPSSDLWKANGIFVVLIHILSIYAVLFIKQNYYTLLMTVGIWQAASIGKKRLAIRNHHGIPSTVVSQVLSSHGIAPSASGHVGNYGIPRIHPVVGAAPPIAPQVL
jgi:hypothetical protein